jgi:PTS system glucose-specific IIA component
MTTIELRSPVSGTIVALSDVQDPVFSQKMMGDGVAIQPTDEWFVSPCDGEITALFPTYHAIGITTPHGLELLIHIGLDTVELNGKGFKAVIKEGATVNTGDRLVKINPKKITKLGKSILTPIIITNMDQVQSITSASGTTKAGDVLLTVQV